jgi:hypothetical protein
MTPAERAFWDRAQRRAAALSPELRTAILRAFEIIRESVPEAELAKIIAAGDLEALFRVALNEAVMDIAFRQVRERIRRGVEANVGYFARDLPKGGKVNGQIVIGFDVLNPKTIEGIRTLDTKVVQTLAEDTREVVRALVENGLRDGKNPRAIARELRQVVGLAPSQAAAVDNFRRMLEEGDREALTRALRDRRFDRTLERAFGADGKGLSTEAINRQVEAYRRRMIAYNAETNARTASIDAMKLGQRLAWDDAAEKGLVDRQLLVKTWRGVKDSRERPSHFAMEGQTVPFDQPFSNGQQIPGESEFNCRCIPIVREKRS